MPARLLRPSTAAHDSGHASLRPSLCTAHTPKHHHPAYRVARHTAPTAFAPRHHLTLGTLVSPVAALQCLTPPRPIFNTCKNIETARPTRASRTIPFILGASARAPVRSLFIRLVFACSIPPLAQRWRYVGIILSRFALACSLSIRNLQPRSSKPTTLHPRAGHRTRPPWCRPAGYCMRVRQPV
jgi:hypothetical protein